MVQSVVCYSLHDYFIDMYLIVRQYRTVAIYVSKNSSKNLQCAVMF